MKQIPYEYHNLPIPGGGYVTGFLYSEGERDVLYLSLIHISSPRDA